MTGSNTPKNPPPPRNPPAPSRPPTKPPNKGYAEAIDATGLAALIADAERQLSSPLHLLVAAVLDADCSSADRAHLNAAAQHVSLALSRLTHIQTPARQSEPVAAVGTIATPGEPDQTTPAWGECLTPGSGAAVAAAAAESTRAVVAPSAGASSGRGGKGADGAPRPVTFTTPQPLGPPCFTAGENRPVGRVERVALHL